MNILTRDVSFQSYNGSNTVCGVVYEPDTHDIKGVIQLVHGMAEHIQRYDHFARFLCSNGFVVCGCDHIGHGRSVTDENGYGYFGHEDGGIAMVEDTKKLNYIVKQEYPNLPFFILGHSMGSFVLRKYITKYSKGLSGVIISGTGGANPLAKIGIKLATRDVRKNGYRNRSQFLDNMAFGNFNKAIKNSKTKSDWLTRDEKIVDGYIKDKACGFVFTSSAFLSVLKLMHEVNTNQWYEQVPKDLPILFISGDQDPVGGYGKGVKKVYQKLEQCGIKTLAMHLYEDGRHEMLNETNRNEVYNDVLNWILENSCHSSQNAQSNVVN